VEEKGLWEEANCVFSVMFDGMECFHQGHRLYKYDLGTVHATHQSVKSMISHGIVLVVYSLSMPNH
jgi:hypothetical protein